MFFTNYKYRLIGPRLIQYITGIPAARMFHGPVFPDHKLMFPDHMLPVDKVKINMRVQGNNRVKIYIITSRSFQLENE